MTPPPPDATAGRPDLVATLAAVRALFAAAACSCALVDETGESLRFVAADGAGSDAIVGVELPVGRGIAGWAAMSGQPIAVRDVRADPRFARDVAESTAYVPDSVLAAPIHDPQGEVIGVVSVLDPTVDQASDWVLAVLGALAVPLAGLALAGPAGRWPDADADAALASLGRAVLEAVRAHPGAVPP